jgi:hypothetical protein
MSVARQRDQVTRRRRRAPCIEASRRPNRLRVKTIFASRINPITPVKPSPQKYSYFFLSEFDVYSARPASA